MAGIKGILKQNATYERYIGRDSRGNIQSEPPVGVKCRKVRKSKWQRSKGEMVEVTVTQYTVGFQVFTGDKLDGEEIYAVEDIVSRKGDILACKAFPRPPQGFTP